MNARNVVCRKAKKKSPRLERATIKMPMLVYSRKRPELDIGGTIGPDSIYVRIISSDGYRFIFKRRLLANSLLLNYWFHHEDQTKPGEEAEVLIKQYPSLCIHYLCLFLLFKFDYQKGVNMPSLSFTVPNTLVFQMLRLAHDFVV